MRRREIVITYVIIVLFIVIGIGYAYLEEDLSLQNNVTLTNYSAKQPVCIKATTLHTETCSRTSNGCYAVGYRSGGIKGTTTITYGHTDSSKLDNGTLKNGLSQGYALTCDVNGDGTYDEATERFYYVSDFYDISLSTPAFNDKYATLIYYDNVGASAYYGTSSSYNNYSGPSALLSSLPTSGSSGTWKNVSLLSERRKIRNESGEVTSGNGRYILVKFVYKGRAARLLTTQELSKVCNNITAGSYTTGELNSCEFLMEDTYYSKTSGWTGGRGYYWLETPVASSTYDVWVVDGLYRYVGSLDTYGSYGVRPAIEVAKSDISLN